MPVAKKKKVAVPLVRTAKPSAAVGDKPVYKIGDTTTFEGYCVKCKGKGPISGTVSEAKNGTLIAKGPHTCGTTVCRILGKPKS